jgi:hypothetical protein
LLLPCTVVTPDTIAIDSTTRRLLGGLFEYRDLGGIEAKGFANGVQAYEVVRPSMVESRFEALRTTSAPLIGRDEEIDLLLGRREGRQRCPSQPSVDWRGRGWTSCPPSSHGKCGPQM